MGTKPLNCLDSIWSRTESEVMFDTREFGARSADRQVFLGRRSVGEWQVNRQVHLPTTPPVLPLPTQTRRSILFSLSDHSFDHLFFIFIKPALPWIRKLHLLGYNSRLAALTARLVDRIYYCFYDRRLDTAGTILVAGWNWRAGIGGY